MIEFRGTHVRWNIVSRPIHVPLPVLGPKILHRVNYTLYVPVYDAFETLKLVPDREDGTVTYTRLFETVHDYYDEAKIESVGAYTVFNGLVVMDSRLVLNLTTSS